MAPTSNDQVDRDAIEDELDSTLFVEAGAGSGKTTALVARVIRLLDSGVDMENIAAITFTEKAAAELKNRLREKLSESGTHSDALDQLDGAAITTLHGFALRILSQHAIEAGLPARLEVSPTEAFEDRWVEFQNRLLHSSQQEQALALARILGLNMGHLRELAQILDSNWDLADREMGNQPHSTGPIELPDVSRFPAWFDEVAALSMHCNDPTDRMLPKLEAIAERAELLRGAAGDEDQILRLLFVSGLSFTKAGRKANWPDDDSEDPSLDEVADQLRELGDAIKDLRAHAADVLIERLTLVLAAFTLEAAEDRRRQGVLEYHDLLVLARNLLRHPQHGEEIREALAERYQRLLLDEFQDTDPIQIELAKLIATPPDDHRHWSELHDEAGRLFFVGDPKQSIYRFRRADIALYAQARQTSTIVRKSLTRNFRSVEPILDWINALFKGFMAPPSSSRQYVQPNYQALDSVRGSPPVGPPVAVLDHEHPKQTRTGELRMVEAQEVAQAILTAVGQGWSVGDGRGENGQDRWRPARLGDICILLPTRTSLPQLEHALEAHGIPYRIEAGSLIWTSQIIREVMATVRALADPTDEVALVNALRSPAFGCGDDNLFTYKVVHHGSWNYTATAPEDLPDSHPVGQAMAWLADLHSEVRWLNPSKVIERIVRERRLMESSCFGQSRARDAWRSLDLVVDQARQFEESGGRGLREFVAWVERKIGERTREIDVILSETDDDAVRITTIHAAKGREFPIVILSGTYAQRRSKSAQVVWPAEGSYGVRFTNLLRTKLFAEHQENEEEMEHAERVRLLYVALTRAKDHLVVSAHRIARGENSTARPSMAEMVVENAAWLPEAEWLPEPLPSEEPDTPLDASFTAWQSEREAFMAAASKPSTMSASRIAWTETEDNEEQLPGLDKDGPTDGDDDRSPLRKGRSGTQIGSAVHAVLQTVDLDADPDSIGPVAAAQAEAEGVSQDQSTVWALTRSALESNTLREAAGSEHWKELFVAAPVDGTVVEGYIDLLYRADEGLVVVDYKTDDIHDDEMRQAKVDRYQLQVAAYSLAVEQAVGEEVARCVLVFARAGQPAEEVTFAGNELASAQQEVRRRLASAAA
ncbi:MAG: AAA family ATPase [Acidimicrobiia bacterium]|nr:AAA family ATPase [Acidimicrobiia bacterium]MYB74511.1 AAA family ATPase [Acidimicrobiia bacterium]MYH98654.1 AAA family ATPase [Acidimicrobiia bacterium]